MSPGTIRDAGGSGHLKGRKYPTLSVKQFYPSQIGLMVNVVEQRQLSSLQKLKGTARQSVIALSMRSGSKGEESPQRAIRTNPQLVEIGLAPAQLQSWQKATLKGFTEAVRVKERGVKGRRRH